MKVVKVRLNYSDVLEVLLITPVVRRLRPTALLAHSLPPVILMNEYRKLNSSDPRERRSFFAAASMQNDLMKQGGLQRHRLDKYDLDSIVRFLNFTRHLKSMRAAEVAAKAGVDALYPKCNKVRLGRHQSHA